jgi:hypothetical protein
MRVQKWLKKSVHSILFFVAAASPLCALGENSPFSSFPPLELPGKWLGNGEVIVSWCKQKQIAVELEIGTDGSVHGRVGDAELESAVIAPNSWLLVLLGNPMYAIEARLNGPLVRAENIRRKSLIILLDLKEERMEGDLHSHDSKFGGRDTMMFSVTRIVLQKVQTPASPGEAGRS